MPYGTLMDMLDSAGSADSDSGLDPQTLELLQTIYRKPVEPVRPASTTPFSQQGRGDKAQTITAALADVARLIQNTNRPIAFGQRPVGFLGQLEGQRQAEADANAQADYQGRVGADQAERGMAAATLNRRDRAAQEERAFRQAETKRALDATDEEAKNLRELKESHAEEVGFYMPELSDDLVNAKNATKALQIIGAAGAEKRRQEKEKDAQRLASGQPKPKELRPPNETDQRVFDSEVQGIDSLVAGGGQDAAGKPVLPLAESLRNGDDSPDRVRSEFRKTLRRKQATMHADLLDALKAEFEREVEPILQAFEDEQAAATQAANSAAKTGDEQARSTERRTGRSQSIPRLSAVSPPAN